MDAKAHGVYGAAWGWEMHGEMREKCVRNGQNKGHVKKTVVLRYRVGLLHWVPQEPIVRVRLWLDEGGLCPLQPLDVIDAAVVSDAGHAARPPLLGRGKPGCAPWTEHATGLQAPISTRN